MTVVIPSGDVFRLQSTSWGMLGRSLRFLLGWRGLVFPWAPLAARINCMVTVPGRKDGMTFARTCRNAPSTWCKRIESRRPRTDVLRCWVAGRGRFVSFSLTRLGWGGEGGGAGSFSSHRPSCCCTSSLRPVVLLYLCTRGPFSASIRPDSCCHSGLLASKRLDFSASGF